MAQMDESTRRERIQRSLEVQGSVTVSELAREFGVSMVTIRKDLDHLERRGVLRRHHGGATRTSLRDEGAFDYRLQDATDRKRSIARRAARLVHRNFTVCLDSSTTAYFLAQELVEQRDLVVVTNAIPAATWFLDHSAATVYLVGGVLRRSSRSAAISSTSGGFSGRIDIGFFGLNSLSPDAGLLEISLAEAESKRSLAASCRRIVALADSSKFTSIGFHPWLAADRIERIITDPGAPPAEIAGWQELGVLVDTGDGTVGGDAPAS